MRIAPLFALACVGCVGFVLGCADRKQPDPGATGAPAKDQAARDKKFFGARITEAKTTPLATLVKEASKFNSTTVRTEGEVVAVCKKMGCWMEIGDSNGQAHVKMAGHAFFVPKDCDGHRAVVQGKLIGRSDPGGSCSDKDDCREEAERATGRVASVEIEATGVELLD